MMVSWQYHWSAVFLVLVVSAGLHTRSWAQFGRPKCAYLSVGSVGVIASTISVSADHQRRHQRASGRLLPFAGSLECAFWFELSLRAGQLVLVLLLPPLVTLDELEGFEVVEAGIGVLLLLLVAPVVVAVVGVTLLALAMFEFGREDDESEEVDDVEVEPPLAAGCEPLPEDSH